MKNIGQLGVVTVWMGTVDRICRFQIEDRVVHSALVCELGP